MSSSGKVYTVDGVWCADNFMMGLNSRGDLEVKPWKGDFTNDALDYQVIMRPDRDVRAAALHYQAIADEDLLVLSTDGSVYDGRGGWAAIQSVGGDRYIHFASGSMTETERPPWAHGPLGVPGGSEVQSHEMELRAPAEALEKAAKIVVQRWAEGKPTWKSIVVLCDSDSALDSVGLYRLKSGIVRWYDYCNISILQSVETLKKFGVRCVFERTTGHSGIPANVAADKVAGAQSGSRTWQAARNWRSPGAGNPIEGLP